MLLETNFWSTSVWLARWTRHITKGDETFQEDSSWSWLAGMTQATSTLSPDYSMFVLQHFHHSICCTGLKLSFTQRSQTRSSNINLMAAKNVYATWYSVIFSLSSYYCICYMIFSDIFSVKLLLHLLHVCSYDDCLWLTPSHLISARLLLGQGRPGTHVLLVALRRTQPLWLLRQTCHWKSVGNLRRNRISARWPVLLHIQQGHLWEGRR